MQLREIINYFPSDAWQEGIQGGGTPPCREGGTGETSVSPEAGAWGEAPLTPIGVAGD